MALVLRTALQSAVNYCAAADDLPLLIVDFFFRHTIIKSQFH